MLKRTAQVLNEYLLRIETLEKTVKDLQLRLGDLENTFEVLKTVTAEKKRTKEIAQKQKWLNGYPDESGDKV